MKKNRKPSPNSKQAGLYKMLKYNRIKEGERARLIREFTSNKYDLANSAEALEAADYIQANWNKFLCFVNMQLKRKIKIPPKKKYKEYDRAIESMW